jgi:thiamine pyrophosphokinase
MRICIVLSGQVLDDQGLGTWLAGRSLLVCADGGARHLYRLGILPDLLIGDLDSIRPQEHAWLEAASIPVHKYPTAKDMTDSELAIEAALAIARERSPDLPPAAMEIVILAAFGSRPDHVLANQLMAANLASIGYKVVLTDGLSHLMAIHGPDTRTIPLPLLANASWAVSAIPVSPLVTGLTYTGLRYPLHDATLTFGSSRAVSNEPDPAILVADKKEPPAISIALASGTLIVILTPAH